MLILFPVEKKYNGTIFHAPAVYDLTEKLGFATRWLKRGCTQLEELGDHKFRVNKYSVETTGIEVKGDETVTLEVKPDAEKVAQVEEVIQIVDPAAIAEALEDGIVTAEELSDLDEEIVEAVVETPEVEEIVEAVVETPAVEEKVAKEEKKVETKAKTVRKSRAKKKATK